MDKKIQCERFDKEGNCIEWRVREDGVMEATIKPEVKVCDPEMYKKIEQKVKDGKLSFKI